MSREEDLIRSTTRAIASAVRDVPPLRIEAALDKLDSPVRVSGRADDRAGPARRWQSWLIPATAAVVVAAIAFALAGVRSVMNHRTGTAGPTASSIPAGVPRYYVAITHGVVVAGDTLTGETLKTFAPPAHTVFTSVTAAADNLTFIVCAMTSASRRSGSPAKQATQTGSWYEVRIAPSTADPVRLIRLRIEPQTAGSALTAGIDFSSVLSGSGKQLAVAEWAAQHFTVKVFLVRTGRLLHEWTASDPQFAAEPSLTWINEDRDLALVNRGAVVQRNSNRTVTIETLRVWRVAGAAASGDLTADSKVSWEIQIKNPATTLQSCAGQMGIPIRLSADGRTFSCATFSTTTAGERLSFLTYRVSPLTTATAKAAIDFQVTLPKERVFYLPAVQWTSILGDKLIGSWSPYPPGPGTGAYRPRIGVISHGTFTPLKIPAGIAASTPADIAF
jgi:hypothetical protein